MAGEDRLVEVGVVVRRDVVLDGDRGGSGAVGLGAGAGADACGADRSGDLGAAGAWACGAGGRGEVGAAGAPPPPWPG